MSRIGKLPVKIPNAVTVSVENGLVSVKGAKGSLSHQFPSLVYFDLSESSLLVSPTDKDNPKARAMWGTAQRLVTSMIKGVSEGYAVKLEITGTGFRAELILGGKLLKLALGFSHPIILSIPTGITVHCEKPTSIQISGYNKKDVTQFAADIRAIKKPEPYKGKGIKYENERLIKKAGKKK